MLPTNEITYNNKNAHKHTFVDYSTSGTNEGVSTNKDGSEMTGAFKAPERVLCSIQDIVEALCKAKSISEGIGIHRTEVANKEEKYFRFELVIKGEKIRFWIANEGARGSFLNTSWNPTKFITGQNVYRPKNVGIVTIGGLEMKLLPADIFEFPFRLLTKFITIVLDRKDWVGRRTLIKQVEQGSIHWRRLDITTYTNKTSRQDIQACLAMMDFMGSSKSVIGVDFANMRSRVVLGLRKFANVKVTGYAKGSDVDNCVYESVVFEKMRDKTDDQQLYRLTIYDKAQEVAYSKLEGNAKVLKEGNNRLDIESRLRMELNLSPTSFSRTPSLMKILLGETSSNFVHTSTAFLREVVLSEEDFDQKRKEIFVAALRDLHFDWIVLPRNPHRMLDKASANPDEEISKVLKVWKEKCQTPLLGADREVSDGLLKGCLRQKSARAAYTLLRENGLDVTRISYLEAVSLWATLVNATISKEDYQLLETGRETLVRVELKTSAKLKLIDEQKRIFIEAEDRAFILRRKASALIHSEVVESNLLE